jgi:hypothetical protein
MPSDSTSSALGQASRGNSFFPRIMATHAKQPHQNLQCFSFFSYPITQEKRENTASKCPFAFSYQFSE